MKSLSRVRLFATPWTVAHQAPPSMGFSGQEYWSGLPFPSPGDLPNPGIKPRSPALQVDVLTSEPPGKPHSSAGKESACSAGDLGSIPGLGRSPGEGKGYPLQYSGLENSMDCNGEIHGLYSLQGCRESDTTERLSLTQCQETRVQSLG